MKLYDMSTMYFIVIMRIVMTIVEKLIEQQ